jgi:ankyrin repeat protein
MDPKMRTSKPPSHVEVRNAVLITAAYLNDSSLLAAMLDDGDHVDINVDHEFFRNPLRTAAEVGSLDAVRLILARPGRQMLPDCKGCLPLHWAVSCGHIHVVRILLEQPDVDVNGRNLDGSTPLLLALQNDKEAIARHLLTRPGVDLTLVDKHFGGALHSAIHGGNGDLVRLIAESDEVYIDDTDSADEADARSLLPSVRPHQRDARSR